MEESNVLDAGTVWMMTSAAMVLLMTPGLAIFYGGMTRAKSSLNMIMMSFVSMGLVGVVWVLWVHGMTGGDGFSPRRSPESADASGSSNDDAKPDCDGSEAC